jgi:hypothetical protein
VLDIAKIESGQFSVNIGEYAIGSIVETVRAAAESLAAPWALSVNAHVPSQQEGDQTFGSALRQMTRPRFLRRPALSRAAPAPAFTGICRAPWTRGCILPCKPRFGGSNYCCDGGARE